ncbi:alpha/beta hydrolase [Pengzhenrongella sp.]|uniref:alpha/beta hydrolase n=1 Tax=Pengzhenrongella sp. TaxID=2888820 RepID=UPI002F91F52A
MSAAEVGGVAHEGIAGEVVAAEMSAAGLAPNGETADGTASAEMIGIAVTTGSLGALDVPATVRGATSHRGIVYAEVRGFRPLLMDVHVPFGATGPVPCVMWVHGGGWEVGDRRFTPPNWPVDLLFGSLVDAGLAVATVDYRLSGEARYPAPLHDLKAAVRFLRTHAEVLGIDAARLGVSGESAGGHLAAMIALTGDVPRLEGTVALGNVGVGAAGEGHVGVPGVPGDAGGGPSSAVQAAAILYGVTDFTAQVASLGLPPGEIPDAPEARFLGATPEQAPSVATAASPVTHATSSAPPMLLISGDRDSVVPLDQSERLRDALLRAGATDVVLEVIAGADHCFDGVDPAPALATVVTFLATRLHTAQIPKAP